MSLHVASPCAATRHRGASAIAPLAFPGDPADVLALAIFRHIAAAYETGDAACWEAAHARAEADLTPSDAALVVARAATVVRVIRIDRPDFRFLPLPCRRLSGDEAALMRLLRASEPGPIEGRAPCSATRRATDVLDSAGGINLLVAATTALVPTLKLLRLRFLAANDGCSKLEDQIVSKQDDRQISAVPM